MRITALFAVLFGLLATAAFAAIFGQIHGVVHDSQHRPIAGARVELHAAGSAFAQIAITQADGSFAFASIPLGDYTVTVRSEEHTSELQSPC